MEDTEQFVEDHNAVGEEGRDDAQGVDTADSLEVVLPLARWSIVRGLIMLWVRRIRRIARRGSIH